jgi:hypothetical protein
MATVSFVRHERRLGRAGAGFWIDVSIVALAISVALLAHLIEIGRCFGEAALDRSCAGGCYTHSQR